MSIVHYAIEIDTGSALTDTSIGCVAGVLRYITDRPGYDGLVPYPTWGAAERASGDIETVWYEGFITKGGVEAAQVSTDLSYLGNYSTTSSFSFKLAGSVDLIMELIGNDINIAGKLVRLFIVIDNVFYQRWGGIVDRHEAGENGIQTVYCGDNFQQLHKIIPPIALSKAQYPDVRQSDEGKSIPVCLGDVPYAKVQNAGADPAWQQMCQSEVADDAGNDKIYASPVIHASYNTDDLVVLYLKTNISVAANQFNGMYAFVVFGTDSDDSYGVRVSDGTADTVSTGGGAFASQRHFTITLEHPFSKSPVDINANHLYTEAVTADIWWVGIASLSARNAVSNGAIRAYGVNPSGMPILRHYNSQTGGYDDISGFVQSADIAGKNGWPHPQIGYISKSAEVSGEVSVFNFVPVEQYLFRSARRLTRFARDRIGGQRNVYFERINRADSIEKIYGFAISNTVMDIQVEIPNEAVTADYDDMYIGFDSKVFSATDFRLESTISAVDCFGKTIYTDAKKYFKRNGSHDLDTTSANYGLITDDADAGDTVVTGVLYAEELQANAWAIIYDDGIDHNNPEWVYITDITGSSVTVSEPLLYDRENVGASIPVIYMALDVNFIPTRMYEVGSAPVYDTSTLFGKVENISGTDYAHADFVKVPSGIVEAIKNGWVSNQVRLEVFFVNSPSSSKVAILLKNLAFIGRRDINTINGGLYSTVQGEPVGAAQTNNPPAMIKKIMEDYDRIPTSEIDYYNIAGSGGKSVWYGGGQLTERKSSFDYLNDICRQFFIAMFPSRLGKRKCFDWFAQVEEFAIFTPATILRDSVEPIEQKTENVYNELTARYGYSDGHGEYLKQISVMNVDKPHYPIHPAETITASASAGQKNVEVADGTWFLVGDILRLTDSTVSYEDRCVVASIAGNVLTMETNLEYSYASGSFIVARVQEYVNGLVGADAIDLWNTCHLAYTRFGSKATMPEGDGELFFVPDYGYFGDQSKEEAGSSAYYFIYTMAQWCTRPKPIVRFAVPITAANAVIDLAELISFSDTLLMPTLRAGYVQSVTLDAAQDRLQIEAVLEPDNYKDDLPGDKIIEVGDAAITITEDGSRDDTITEGGQ